MKPHTTAYNRYIVRIKREDSLTRAIIAAILGVVGILVCLGLDAPAIAFLLASLWTASAVVAGLYLMARLYFSRL